MTLRDPYVWIDPADLVFLAATREALAMERRAYELADAERRKLLRRLERVRVALEGRGS